MVWPNTFTWTCDESSQVTVIHLCKVRLKWLHNRLSNFCIFMCYRITRWIKMNTSQSMYISQSMHKWLSCDSGLRSDLHSTTGHHSFVILTAIFWTEILDTQLSITGSHSGISISQMVSDALQWNECCQLNKARFAMTSNQLLKKVT